MTSVYHSPPLTEGQTKELHKWLTHVLAAGFGEVVIEIRNGKVRFFRVTQSVPISQDRSYLDNPPPKLQTN